MAATSLTFDEGDVIVVHCSALLSYGGSAQRRDCFFTVAAKVPVLLLAC